MELLESLLPSYLPDTHISLDQRLKASFCEEQRKRLDLARLTSSIDQERKIFMKRTGLEVEPACLDLIKTEPETMQESFHLNSHSERLFTMQIYW